MINLFFSTANEDYQTSLHKPSLNYMRTFVNTLTEVCAELVNGTIALENLSALLSEKERFQSIVQEINCKEACFVLMTLPIREKEFTTFKNTLRVVKEFVYACKKVDGKNILYLYSVLNSQRSFMKRSYYLR